MLRMRADTIAGLASVLLINVDPNLPSSCPSSPRRSCLPRLVVVGSQKRRNTTVLHSVDDGCYRYPDVGKVQMNLYEDN